MSESCLKQQFPKNRIISDCNGKETVMVYIEKFYLDEVIDGASHVPHPAFAVDGKELDGIYVSKFQNTVIDGLAYSLPCCDPATNITFDTAISACLSKGPGFHLMTAAEWGAIALWCQKNDCIPFGNNDCGKDIRESLTLATPSYFDEERSIFRVQSGTGPLEWSHNRQDDGIYDLNANVWEWVGGLRLVYGELQILQDNDCASEKYSQAENSKDWKAINGKTGELITPDGNGNTENSVKLDFVNDCWMYTSEKLKSCEDKIRFCKFSDVYADSSICEKAKEILTSLICIPCDTYKDENVSLYANNGCSERIPFRGGRWGQGLNSGLFKTCLDDPRSYSGDAVGFRSAYYEM